MTENLEFKRTAFDHPDFQLLIKELDKEFWVRYPLTQQNFEPFNKVDDSCRVILVYHKSKPMGCGCFRPKQEQTVEIKRMYVQAVFRNKGIARKILQMLEDWSVSEGFSRSILETGNNQPEAIASYKKSGYRIIPNFPPYENVTESICMEKILKPAM
jgi:GNAT superfamily N-acetyltransferase